MDYEKDLQIDHNALDVEWLDQPQKFMRYSVLHTDACLKVDKAKENLDVVQAELSMKIRKDPDDYDIPKVTEATVSNAITLSPEFQEANLEYIKAKHEANILLCAVKAFDQRKRALEHLVQLLGQQYFASPSAPRDLDLETASQNRKTEARDKVRRRMKRSRKDG